MAAKQVIILERLDGPQRYRVALWAAVPVARQTYHVNANATSAFSGIAAQELTDLRAGKFIERVTEYSSPDGGLTLAQLKAALEAMFTAFQTQVTAENQFSKYGTFFDGATWTTAGA